MFFTGDAEKEECGGSGVRCFGTVSGVFWNKALASAFSLTDTVRLGSGSTARLPPVQVRFRRGLVVV